MSTHNSALVRFSWVLAHAKGSLALVAIRRGAN